MNITWDENDNPVEKSIHTLLYAIRAEDTDGLIFDSVTMADVIEDSDGYLATFDSLITPYARLKRKMTQLNMVMNKAVSDFGVVDYQISQPFRQRGGVHVAVIFELTDGQTITIFFHSPALNPKNIKPTDELVSWKWMINKKDVTIVVAPEKGKDIPVREVGRRVMKLAQRNSSAFQKANERRAERLKEISDYEKEIAELEAKLADLLKQIEVARFEKEERELKALEEKKQPIEKIVGERMKGNGWTEIFEGDNTILRKFYKDIEIKASLINKKVTLVADPVKEIQITLDLSDSDHFINTTIEDSAEALADDLLHENKISDPEYIVSEYINKLEWGVQRWEKNSGESQLKKEFTYGDFKFNVFLKVEAEKVIFTNDKEANNYTHVIANSDLDDFDLEIKSQAEQYADISADSIVLNDIKNNLEKLGFSSEKLDEHNLTVKLKRTLEKLNICCGDGLFEFDAEDKSYNISSNMDEINEIKGGFSKAKNKDIAVMIDELDFKSYEYDSDFDLDSDEGMPTGFAEGKTLKFAKSLADLIEVISKNKKILNIAIGDFNKTAGNFALFDDIAKQKGVYGITAQIGYIKYGEVLARVEINEDGNAVVYSGENGQEIAGSLTYGEDNFINGFISIFQSLINKVNESHKSKPTPEPVAPTPEPVAPTPEPEPVIEPEQGGESINDFDDLLIELEKLGFTKQTGLSGLSLGDMSVSQHWSKEKAMVYIDDKQSFVSDDLNEVLEYVKANIPKERILADYEKNAIEIKNILLTKKMAVESKNIKHNKWRLESKNKDGIPILLSYSHDFGNRDVVDFDVQFSDDFSEVSILQDGRKVNTFSNDSNLEVINALDNLLIEIDLNKNPENKNMISVEKFLDDMINKPENHTSMDSYEKLESVIANPNDVPKEIQEKASKALEVYNAYALVQVANLMQEMQEQMKANKTPLPS